MRVVSLLAGSVWFAAMLAAQTGGGSATGTSAPLTVTRAVAHVNGITSPRGFFNLEVRLHQVEGVEWAKFDLKKAQITIDFHPGVSVSAEDIRGVMSSAGYRPGAVQIQVLPQEDALQTGPGWKKIKHPTAKNPVARWFELNF